MAAEHPLPAGIPLEYSYKNRLQEFTQRASIPLPVYQTFNEGPQHGAIFKSQVSVDEACFVSPNTFPNRKMSEQDAAKHALVGVIEKVKNESCSCIMEDTFFCKLIMNEYALKMTLDKPTYKTNESKAVVPIFVSTLVLKGVSFTGDPARTKKDAEQFAARSAILSILGSEPGTTMLEIVKSKFKLFNELKKVKGDVPPVATPLDSAPPVAVLLDSAPPVAKPLDGALVPTNKRKQADASAVQAGNAPSGATPLEGPLVNSKNGKEVEVIGGSISDLVLAILLSNKFKDSSAVQAGDPPAVATPLDGALVSSDKGKEGEDSSRGSINGIISSILQSNLLSNPAIQSALMGSPHQQPPHVSKKPKFDDTPSGSENPETSAKGRKRKNKKAKKKMSNNQAMIPAALPAALVPHSQVPVFSVAE